MTPKASPQTPTPSQKSKPKSKQPTPTSKTSEPTTPADFDNGNLDHTATAEQLEYIAKTGINIANQLGTIAAIRNAKHNSEHLLGLADWHLQQAENQKKQEKIFLLSELNKSATNILTKTN